MTIEAFLRPNALASAAATRRGWNAAVTRQSNGWGIVNAEQHRVAAIKGNDLVFFAPAASDFDNPVPLTEALKAQALSAALDWTKKHATMPS